MSRTAATVLIGALLLASAACGGNVFGRTYEYEEDLYISTDGTASLIVNASIPALVALRGLDLPVDPAARLDRDRVRDAYETPVTNVTRVSRPWRRHGRRYVQIRVNVSDINRLSTAAPFSWSTYDMHAQDGHRVYRQTVGASALRPGTLQNVGWSGGELVAFRLHLPSRILYHNARDLDTGKESQVRRGNILAWEQLLTERLDGRPIEMDVRMDTQSILYRTLWLFAGAFAAAVLLLGIVVWLTMRKGAREATPAP